MGCDPLNIKYENYEIKVKFGTETDKNSSIIYYIELSGVNHKIIDKFIFYIQKHSSNNIFITNLSFLCHIDDKNIYFWL